MKFVSQQLSFVNRLCLLTFVILSIVFAVNAQSAQSTNDITETEINGLKVIIKRRPNTPTVSAGLFIRGGVRNITAENAGIETLMLDTATAASKKYPRETMRKELSKMGSSIGGGGNYDFSVISLASTRQNFDKTWDIFTDVVFNPSFTPEDFNLARERTLTGLRNQSSSPESFLEVVEEKTIYANHPYANSPTGSVETIGKLKIEDLRAYHKKVMQTSQLLLVIVGDLDPKEIQNRVSATLAKLPRGNYKAQSLPQISFAKPSVDVTSRTIPTNYIKGVFAAPSVGDPDYSAMRVAVTILQSRVYQEVRTKRNLSYAPNAEMDDFAANSANIYVTTTDANQSVSLMLREIEDMRKNKVSEDDFSAVPGFYLTTYYVKQETNAAQVAELAKYELIGGGWKNSLQFLDKIRAVTADDVQRVAQKYMKNLRFVVIGNPTAINNQIFIPSEQN